MKDKGVHLPGGALSAGSAYPLRASARSSCTKADAMRSVWDFVGPKAAAASRHRATAAPTSAAIARACLCRQPEVTSRDVCGQLAGRGDRIHVVLKPSQGAPSRLRACRSLALVI